MPKAKSRVTVQEPRPITIESKLELEMKNIAEGDDLKRFVSDKIQLTEFTKAFW